MDMKDVQHLLQRVNASMDMKDVQHLLQRTIPYPCDNTLSISFIL